MLSIAGRQFSPLPPRPRIRRAGVLFTNCVGICGKGFLIQPRRERRAYPQRSARSEQRRLNQKDLPPGGLRRIWFLASLLLGRRARRLCSLVAPRQKPNPTQQMHTQFVNRTLVTPEPSTVKVERAERDTELRLLARSAAECGTNWRCGRAGGGRRVSAAHPWPSLS